MAYTFVRSVGTAAQGTANPIVLTVGASGAASGDLLAVFISWSNGANGATSVTDTAGNVYVKARGHGAASGGEIWLSRLTSALVSGNTISGNGLGAAPAVKTIEVLEFAGGSGQSVGAVNSATLSVDLPPPASITASAASLVLGLSTNATAAATLDSAPANYTQGAAQTAAAPSMYAYYSIMVGSGARALGSGSVPTWSNTGTLYGVNVEVFLTPPTLTAPPETPRPFFFLPGLPSIFRPWSFLRMPPPPIPVSTAQVYTMNLTAGLTFSGAFNPITKKAADAWLDFHNLIHRSWLMVTGSYSVGGLSTFGDAAGTAVRVADALALGGMAIQITTVNANDYGIYLTDFIPITAGVIYEFGVWTHSDAGSGFPQVVVIEFYDNTPTFITGFTQGWRWTGSTPAYANIVSTAPAGATQARVYYKHSGLAFNSYTNRFIFKESSGGLRFAKQIGKPHTGGLSFVGGILRQDLKDLQGGLTFVGALVTGVSAIQQALAGGLSFVGAFFKQTNKPNTGGLTFVGSLSRLTSKVYAAGLSFVGSIQKVTQRAFPGGLSFSGAFSAAKVAIKVVTGGLSFVGAFLKQTNKPFSGGLTFSGVFSKAGRKILSGGLSFVGAIVKIASRVYTAGLSFVGALIKIPGKTFTGGLTFSGAFLKRAGKVVSGALTFVGAHVPVRISGGSLSQILTASLSFVGGLQKVAGRPLQGGLSFSGLLSRLGKKNLTAGLTFNGVLVRAGRKTLSGALSFVGALTKGAVHVKAIIGAIIFDSFLVPPGAAYTYSTLTKRIGKSFTGTISFSGDLKQRLGWIFAQMLAIPRIVTIVHMPRWVQSILHRPRGDG